MIAITLNQNISCEHICQQIQRLIEKNQQSHGNKDFILTINLKEVSYDDNSMIPKIEYKSDNCPT